MNRSIYADPGERIGPRTTPLLYNDIPPLRTIL